MLDSENETKHAQVTTGTSLPAAQDGLQNPGFTIASMDATPYQEHGNQLFVSLSPADFPNFDELTTAGYARISSSYSPNIGIGGTVVFCVSRDQLCQRPIASQPDQSDVGDTRRLRDRCASFPGRIALA